MTTLGVVAPAAAAALPDDVDIVVRGGGWGHGHGMSQYGARAAAEDGLTTNEILHHYYSGISIEDRGNPLMRVLLTSKRGVVVGGGPESYSVSWKGGDTIRSRSDAKPFTRIKSIDASTVKIHKGATPTGPWSWVATGDGHVLVSPDDGDIVATWRSGRLEYFRGVLEAYHRNGDTMYLVNELRLNEYLFGVVPREMPASWHMRALKAQAIAARSYSRWKRKSAGANASYHICATTFCQVYRGYGLRADADAPMEVLEHPRTNDAILRTSGDTMMDPDEGPIFAEYHSTSGGHTGQGSRSYLAPVPDPYDAVYSPYHRWSTTIDVRSIVNRWPSLGSLVEIKVTARDGDGPFGGRVETIKMVGTETNETVSGGTFRSAMGLRSELFRLDIYDAELAQPIDEVNLAPGTSATASIKLRNTGTVPWPVGDDIRLGTAQPLDRDSGFAAGDWLTDSKASGIDADLTDGGAKVRPGEVALIEFTLTAPSNAAGGSTSEAFRLKAKGLSWFGPVIDVPIRLGFDGQAHLGGNLLTNSSFEVIDADLAGWRSVSGPAPVQDGLAIDGDRSLRLPAIKDRATQVKQSIGASGRKGHRFIISAWQRSDASGREGASMVKFVLQHKDGSRTTKRLSFPRGTHGWTFREMAVEAPRGYRDVIVRLSTVRQKGDVWFDGVRVTRNRVVDGSFEGGGSEWDLIKPRNGGVRGDAVRHGRRALALDGRRGVDTYARQRIALRGKAGATFRVGAWTRAVDSTAGRGVFRMLVKLKHANGGLTKLKVDVPTAAHDWTYSERIITAPKYVTKVNVLLRFKDQTGTAWFDEVFVRKGAGGADLLGNGGFDLGSPDPAAWTLMKVGETGATVTAEDARDASALHIEGASSTQRYARQDLPIAGTGGDRLTLSGWNKTSGSDPDGGAVRIWARAKHLDGTWSSYKITFDKAPHGWTYGERTFAVDRAFIEVRVYVWYADQTGDAWFDSIALRPTA